MNYRQFGISEQLVERIKLKLKNKSVKDRVKKLVEGLSKADLQDPSKVQRLVKSSSTILSEKLTGAQEQQLVQFVVAQKIDPKNTLHLLKLWGMFR
ncbi:uncharacterized protein YpuA (DUF1002 family) [Paenibacillus shirakamiensis]|uniref:Uncharacterized protein YpuA (DUF1002 family) n=1 Tax=Paenibacillus shirakamiensis TaxID=1265935 RepID=A0ABS4JCG1_9BACL|nr:stage VI sporulation protein F [Paenibacillus shirakamiensis]MBP1999365.1 uncharacterized protein YpuA (DUF1002 family) [Paenibacillus shirakamiensis]